MDNETNGYRSPVSRRVVLKPGYDRIMFMVILLAVISFLSPTTAYPVAFPQGAAAAAPAPAGTSNNAAPAPVELGPNPWTPVRNVAPAAPTSATTGSGANDSFKQYRFVVRDFLIVLACIVGFIGLAIGVAVIFRLTCRKKAAHEIHNQFIKEEEALARRVNSIRDPRRGAAGMRGDSNAAK
ncbi:hypothetical protein BJ742DRAFT_850209 [Cladochytrium replicatum]|nr:hypothetical protein BJ742DRAFT_850209 [Cladochytrium replicatum]